MDEQKIAMLPRSLELDVSWPNSVAGLTINNIGYVSRDDIVVSEDRSVWVRANAYPGRYYGHLKSDSIHSHQLQTCNIRIENRGDGLHITCEDYNRFMVGVPYNFEKQGPLLPVVKINIVRKGEL